MATVNASKRKADIIADSITSTGNVTGSNLNISNWDIAHGWGNHASAGYITSIPSEYLTQTEGDSRYYTKTVSDLRYAQITGDTFTGNVTAPTFTGSLRGALTGAPDATIWCVSGQYDDWGIFYDEGNPDKIQYRSGGTTTATIALDTGAGYFNGGLTTGTNGDIATGVGGDLVAYGHVTASYGYVSASSGASGGFRIGGTRKDLNWDTAYGWGDHSTQGYLTTYTDTTYSTATSGTLGLVKIGYAENGKNYPVELSNGQMFVNVPWVDTNTNTWRPIHDTPVNGATTTSISSNWAFDNVKKAVPANAVFTDTVYTHPTHPSDDLSVDTGQLTGATVISDLDFNVTTDGLGHVTDANATVATRNLTAANIGAAPASHNHDDRYYTESEVQTYMDRGYINRHSATNLAVGWYTIATNTGDRASARFGIWDTNSGDHQSVTFYAAHHFGTNSSNTLTVLDNSYYSGNPFRYIRIKDAGTYDGAALQVYIDDGSNSVNCAILGDNFQSAGWVLCDWIPDVTTPPNVSNYGSFGERSKVDLNTIAQGGFATTGEIYAGGDTSQHRVFHNNYHPNADKWTTASTLSLTGDVTGSVSWDGSANASITATVANDSHTHDGRYYTETESDSRFVNITGDTMTGNLNFTADDVGISYTGHSGIYMEGKRALWSHNNGHVTLSGAGGDLYLGFNSGSTYVTGLITLQADTYNANKTIKIIDHDTGRVWSEGSRTFTDNYHPNADKWTTAVTNTVTLTGDASGSGSASVDGTGNWNVSVPVVVNNDSHNHTHSDGDFTVNGGGVALSNKYMTKSFGLPYFTNGVANLAVDITLGNHYIQTVMELEITGTYSNQNTTGLIRRKWYMGFNANNGIWESPKVIDETIEGYIASQIYVSDPFWDSGASTYKIRVYHKVSTGNAYTAKISLLGSGHSDNLLSNLSVGSIITASTTSSHTVGYNAKSGYRVNGTTVIDSSRNLTSIGNIGSSGTVTANGFNVSTLGGIKQAQGEFGIGSGSHGIHFNNSGSNILPFNYNSGAWTDAVTDLGHASYRFKDGFYSGILTTGSVVSGNLTSSGRLYFNKNGQTGYHSVIDIDHVENNLWPMVFQSSSVGNDNESGFWIGSNGYPDMRLRRDNGTVRALISSWEESFVSNGFNVAGGNLEVGGTTVIDSSRNIKNIGSIHQQEVHYPNVQYSASGNTTGRIKIALPDTSSTYDMMTIELTIYEYNSDSGTKIYLSGHNWTSGWYNTRATVIGGYSSPIYLARSSTDGKHYIILGDTGTAWNYVTVHVDKVTTAGFYNAQDWTLGWAVTKVTSENTTYSQMSSNMNQASSKTLQTRGHLYSNGLNVGGQTIVDSSRNLTNIGHFQNGSMWVNDGSDYNGYNENIRLFNAPNGVSVIGFSCSGISGTPTTSLLGYSDRFETRVGSTWRTRVYGGYLDVNGYVNSTGYRVGSTEVINSSRNLINLGGSIKSDSTFAFLTQGGGAQYGRFRGISTHTSYSIGVYSGEVNAWSGFRIANTQIVDASRNLVNINAITATGSGMGLFSTDMSSNDDWQNSPISIRERGMVSSAQSADTYAPNLNFHWAGRASNSLWMNSSGHLVYGSYSSTGTPNADGSFASGDVRTNIVYDLADTSTYLEMRGDGGGVRVKTSNGYIDFGAQNSSWAHIITDRSGFYFNTGVTVDSGIVQSYNEDLVLRRARSSSHQMTLNTSGATFTGNVTAYSDVTLKGNITEIDNALDKVNSIRGVTYDRIDQDNARHAGVIAQEVEAVLPEVVHTDDNGIKSVAYGNMVGLLIEAIKEQQVQIDELKSKLEK